MRTSVRLPAWATGLIGGVVLIALWWLIAITVFAPPEGVAVGKIPTPVQVIADFGTVGWDYYIRNFSVTLREAGIGYAWGNGLALLCSAVVLLVPRSEKLIMQIATVTYCVPIIAIGPVILLIFGAPKVPGSPSGTAVFLAALSVFFTTVVGTILGLKAADKASLDVIRVYGGGRVAQLFKVRLITALPHVMNALQIAVPAAFLGAVLGEFFGKVDVGVGPAMIAAQQGSNAARLWGLALVSGALSLLGYFLVGLINRAIAPWSRGRAS